MLPESFQANASRLARFEREARLLAALNHPGIASIYGLEHSDGGPLLVLELVEGATLSERLRRGPLPLREALDVGRQIAAALDAAHEKGIIHRDLKPSNVKLTPDGKVKLLDFGLAKALEPEVPADEVSKDPTETSPTSGGAVLGTAPYMSPEQARGETADKRTDVWSFGCVLYEALTGKRAFPGPTTSDTVAAVLDREPDWRALPEATPPLVRSLLGRCLQKDKGRRLRDIADARIEIEEALAQPAVAIARPDVAPTRRRLRILAAAVVAASLGAATVWILERGRPPNTHAPRRFNVQLPSAAPLFDGPRGAPTNTPFAVSPDGTFLLYLAEGPPRKLYVRPLERLAARAIPGTEGAYNPFFSPDGRWIGFTADGKLKKVRVDGGPPSTICDASQLRGASWAEDGTIVFTPRSEGGLARVSAEGGSPETLTTPVPAKEGSHRWPQYLPGARLVLFTITSASGRQDEGRIAILSLDTGERRILVDGGTYGRYVPSGHLVYANGGSLLAAPLDLVNRRITGPTVSVIDDVRMDSIGSGSAQFDFSRDGLLLYEAPYPKPRERSLAWIDLQGNARPAAAERRGYQEPRMSPDGRLVVVPIEGPTTSDLWQYDISREAWRRLTSEKDNLEPLFSPDGRHIAFASNREGPYNLYRMAVDGTAVERLATSDHWQWPASWSPDGRTLIFMEPDPETNWDIWALPLDGERKPKRIIATRFDEGGAALSPDGRWLAYTSNESGRNEVYARPWPGPDRKWLVSTGGGFHPVWARNGRSLFYSTGERLMEVKVTAEAQFRAGQPRLRFAARFADAGTIFAPPYDIAPDGQRFVASLEGEATKERVDIVAVPDWFEELKARVPAPSR